MITCAEIKTAGGAAVYFDDAFSKEGETSKGADNYYLDGNAKMTWHGKGAEVLGIDGSEVTREDFLAMLGGQMKNPITGQIESLGDNSKGHRAGWDLTFSPPKSFSTVALVGDGDPRLVEAFHRVNQKVMGWIEEHGAQFRSRQDGEIETSSSGGLLYGSTAHMTNRHNEPNIHIHNPVVNATWDEQSGKWRSLTNDEIFRIRSAADKIGKNELHNEVKSLGYRTEIGRDGNFEIAGASRVNDAFSTRTKVMEEDVERHYLENGIDPKNATYEQRQVAKQAVRPAKDETSVAEANIEWKEVAAREGIDFGAIVSEAKARSEMDSRVGKQPNSQNEADKAVAKAIAHLGEPECAFKASNLEVEAAIFGKGNATLAQIKEAIKAKKEDGKLIDRSKEGVGYFTTKEGIAREQKLFSSIDAGKGNAQTMFSTETEFHAAVDKYNKSMQEKTGNPEWKLSGEQVNAAKNMTMHKDQVQVVQGDAGTGKTAAIAFIVQAAEQQGWMVRGYATTGQAAKGLSQATGMKTDTLAGWEQGQGRQEAQLQKEIDALEAKMPKLGKKSERPRFEQFSANVRTLGAGFAKDQYSIDHKTGKVFRANVGITNVKNWMAVAARDKAQKGAGLAKRDFKNAETLGQKMGAGARFVGHKLVGNIANDSITWTRCGGIEAVAVKALTAWKSRSSQKAVNKALAEKRQQLKNLREKGNIHGKNCIVVLDEAGMASTKSLTNFVSASVSKGMRTVVQGDVKQQPSVGEGKAFEQMQEDGRANVSLLETTQRFHGATKDVKEAHEIMRSGDFSKAVEKLMRPEIKGDSSVLHKEVAKRYMEIKDELSQDKSKKPGEATVGIVTTTNADRIAINEEVRTARRDAGELKGQDFVKEHTRDPHLTSEAKKDVGRLADAGINCFTAVKGDRSLGAKAGQRFDVISMDSKSNKVTVRGEDGQIRTFDPSTTEAMKPAIAETRAFAQGDEVTARGNIGEKFAMEQDAKTGKMVRQKDEDGLDVQNKDQVKNGEKGVVIAIDEKSTTVSWGHGENERVAKLNNVDMRSVDHSYARTVTKEQGDANTRQIVVVSKEGARGFSSQAAYVALTRGRNDTEVMTNDKKATLKAAGQKQEKTTATEQGTEARDKKPIKEVQKQEPKEKENTRAEGNPERQQRSTRTVERSSGQSAEAKDRARDEHRAAAQESAYKSSQAKTSRNAGKADREEEARIAKLARSISRGDGDGLSLKNNDNGLASKNKEGGMSFKESESIFSLKTDGAGLSLRGEDLPEAKPKRRGDMERTM